MRSTSLAGGDSGQWRAAALQRRRRESSSGPASAFGPGAASESRRRTSGGPATQSVRRPARTSALFSEPRAAANSGSQRNGAVSKRIPIA